MKIEGVANQYALAVTGSEETARAQETGEASGEENLSPAVGDTVNISEEGRSKAMKLGAADETGGDSEENQGGAVPVETDDESGDDSVDKMAVERIKDRIKELQEELQEVQKDETMSEKQKQQKIQQINQELAELMDQLSKATGGASFNGAIQGTRAEGFSSSLT